MPDPKRPRRGPDRLTEADENAFRNLFARIRGIDPKRFLELLCSGVLAPMEQNTISSITISDDDDKATALILVFKGDQVTSWAQQAEAELRKKLQE